MAQDVTDTNRLLKGWPYGRVYSPAEVNARPLPNPTHHTVCSKCGGYVQGTREVTGVCLNCEEGRGWIVTQAKDDHH